MPVPIISVSQMRQWEQATWASGQTEESVIARVGEWVAQRALRMTQPRDPVLILAGKGHNGDDARHAEPWLRERPTWLVNVTDPRVALPEITARLQERPGLIIDGLFGIGLNRPLDETWGRLIRCVNETHLPVLAVDTPSGLDADTGKVLGEAMRATVTLTLGAPKRGLLTSEAAPFVGRLEVAPDIGLISCPLRSDAWWTLSEDFRNWPPPRPVAGHKGTFGHLAILAGSLGYHGAAVLAARGAQRARPGLITLFPQETVYGPVAAQLQAVMVHPFDAAMSFENHTAVLVGPGLASPTVPAALRTLVHRLWIDFEQPVIVDASALDWLVPEEPTPSGALRVMTPHPGEAARLLKCRPADVQADRLGAVRQISERFGDCWVVLKGHQTVIGRATDELFVNSSGNPELAQGGSGDVLAGYLAGWLAQSQVAAHASLAIRHAVWRHGAAADALSEQRRAWVVEELLEALGREETPW